MPKKKPQARLDLVAGIPEFGPAVKTSLKLREDLWKRARILALERRSELQIIVNQALEAYLRRHRK